jgi:transcriptional regulator with XRE-family HTH domain
MWTLKDRLVKSRKDAGLTQPDIADRIGMSLRQVVRYEDKKGHHIPSRGILIAWAWETSVDYDWLVGDRPGPTVPATLDRRRAPRTTGRPTIGEAGWYPYIPALELLRLRPAA